jgi:hypothetical protein
VPTVLHAVRGADVIGLVTEWSEFGSLDWETVRSAAAGDVVVDGRNALDPVLVAAAGFRYIGFGRRVERPARVSESEEELAATAGESGFRIRAAIAATD